MEYTATLLRISPIELEKNGGDFGYLLAQELSSQLGIAAQYTIATGRLTPGGVEIRVESSPLRTWLELAKTESGYVPLIVGESHDEIEPELSVWEQAILAAYSRLVADAPKRTWNGIIGPLPRQRFQRQWRMVNSARFGTLTHAEAETYMVEGLPGDHWWGMAINTSEGSWPIVIEGTSHAHDDQRLTSMALEDMTQACCMLSLALAEPWIPRGHPWDVSFHRWEIPAVPEGTPAWITPSHPAPEMSFSISAWLPAAWQRIQSPSGSHLKDSIWAFREGLLLLERHPSFALVAFTSALETIAFRKYEHEGVRCVECGQVKGSTSRFRRLLIEHLGKKRAKWFVDFYSRRSKTVHQATLYGSERSSGWRRHDVFFAGDSIEDLFFEGNVGWNFGRVTREIILNELALEAVMHLLDWGHGIFRTPKTLPVRRVR